MDINKNLRDRRRKPKLKSHVNSAGISEAVRHDLQQRIYANVCQVTAMTNSAWRRSRSNARKIRTAASIASWCAARLVAWSWKTKTRNESRIASLESDLAAS